MRVPLIGAPPIYKETTRKKKKGRAGPPCQRAGLTGLVLCHGNLFHNTVSEPHLLSLLCGPLSKGNLNHELNNLDLQKHLRLFAVGLYLVATGRLYSRL